MFLPLALTHDQDCSNIHDIIHSTECICACVIIYLTKGFFDNATEDITLAMSKQDCCKLQLVKDHL